MPQGAFPYCMCFSVANVAVNWGCTVDGETVYLAVDPQCPIMFTLFVVFPTGCHGDGGLVDGT